ncbi:MAG: hypothetical protein KBT47_07580 [Armatimonadetes bacterium]|nr:hypothetical protein [Candidatus Hippobium faecium]
MINTVLGEKKIEDLGYILPHEHIFIDLTNEFAVPENPEFAKVCFDELSLETFGNIRLNPYLMKDNFILDNYDVMLNELKIFKAHGGNTIIDNTNIGINRDVNILKKISSESGVNVICGSGYYTGDTHPESINDKTEKDIAEEILSEFECGIDGTDIKPGIIGEIGTSKAITENEKKSLIGSALAQKELHAPMQIHLHPWGVTGLEVCKMLKPLDVDMSKIVICHIDVELNMDLLKKLLDYGVYIQFDNIAKEFFIPDPGAYADGPFASDRERAEILKKLCDMGYASQILLSNDVCLKQMLHKYGGWGFDYILVTFREMMKFYGVSEEDTNKILFDNPKNWLK